MGRAMKKIKPKNHKHRQADVHYICGEHLTIADIMERTGKHEKFVQRALLKVRRGEIPGPLTWEMFK